MNRSRLGVRRPTVVVTDAGTASGIAVCRSLGQAGWRVEATDAHRFNPAFASKLVTGRHVVPLPELHPDRSADEVLDIAVGCGADLIFPTTDQSLFPLLDRAELLDEGTAIAAASPEALAVAQDKHRTLLHAEKVGVVTPEWRVADDVSQLRSAGAELGWPVVCKPLMSHEPTDDGTIRTRAVTFARSAAELDELIADGTVAAPILVQAYVDGVGVGVDLLMSDGRVVAAFQHRRLREVPIWGGMSAARVSESTDAQLLDLACDLLTPLRWTGLAMVELRMTAEGPVLMEINGRVWGSIALPIRAGLDFPTLAADLHRGVPVDKKSDYRVGVVCRNLELELRWVAQALRQAPGPTGQPIDVTRVDALRVLAGLGDPRGELDIQMASDPGPGLVDAVAAVAALAVRGMSRTATWNQIR